MKKSSEVVVIGAGIQGCAAAFFLARRGISVRVLDKDYPGRHASGVNAGGVRTLGRHLLEIPLSLAAKTIWLEIADLLDFDVGFRPVGQVRVAETEAELGSLKARSDAVAMLRLGYCEELIGQEQLRELVPALARHCLGALHVRDDGFANPFLTTQGFRHAAIRHGAVFESGFDVAAIDRQGAAFSARSRNGQTYQAAKVLNCAGAWGGRVAAALGDRIVMVPNGSMLMVTARMPRFLGPVVGAAGRSLSFKQFPNGTVLIGGGHRAPVDIDRNLAPVTLSGMARAASTAIGLFPRMADVHAVRFWSGIEGFMTDGLPVLSESRASPGAYHAFGFSAHGFQLAPAVGRILAELVCGEAASVDLSPFSMQRLGA
jgi:sarcosine oxidase subunit beta